jgi:hypothetical protein
MGTGGAGGSVGSEAHPSVEPPPEPSGWAMAGLAAITAKPAIPDVVVSTRTDNVAALISLRTVLWSMITPHSRSIVITACVTVTGRLGQRPLRSHKSGEVLAQSTRR